MSDEERLTTDDEFIDHALGLYADVLWMNVALAADRFRQKANEEREAREAAEAVVGAAQRFMYDPHADDEELHAALDAYQEVKET